jgi:hypothetical protein
VPGCVRLDGHLVAESSLSNKWSGSRHAFSSAADVLVDWPTEPRGDKRGEITDFQADSTANGQGRSTDLARALTAKGQAAGLDLGKAAQYDHTVLPELESQR